MGITHVKTAKGKKERVYSCIPSKLREMLETYGVNKQGLVFISQRGRKYNERTIQQIVCSKKARIKKEGGHSSYSKAQLCSTFVGSGSGHEAYSAITWA